MSAIFIVCKLLTLEKIVKMKVYKKVRDIEMIIEAMHQGSIGSIKIYKDEMNEGYHFEFKL